LEEISPEAARRLLVAAIDSFAKDGYGATTTRDIARLAGLSPAGLYVHYPSKAKLLHEIWKLGYRSSLAAVESALKGAATPVARVEAFVRTLTVWHAYNHSVSRVLLYEVRALEEEAEDEFEDVRLRRGQFERLLRREIQAGKRSGAFEVDDVRVATRALLSLAADVSRWYRPNVDASPERLGAAYGKLAIEMLGPRGS
jgi:AcrR family transcriptional regulator